MYPRPHTHYTPYISRGEKIKVLLILVLIMVALGYVGKTDHEFYMADHGLTQEVNK